NITLSEQTLSATTSHRNLAEACDESFSEDFFTPYLGVQRETYLRPCSSPQKLAKLKPVFCKRDAAQHGTTATMTAGNSTPLTDGAAAVLLSSEESAKERKLPVLAYLVDAEVGAVACLHGHDG